jgi:5-methylcytosine-specific restriction endonuclease McrA
MRICSGAGCLRTVQDDVKLCDECRGGKTGDGIKVHSNADRDRLGPQYGSRRWKSVQSQVLSRDPLCQRCKADLSTIADHKVPAGVAIEQCKASGNWPCDPVAGFYLLSNLQGLCRSCHAVKTNEDKAHQGEWPDVVAAHAAAPKKTWF